MVCIGYVGIEAFDVILYISQSLTKLNYRVLIVDFADTGAMMKAIKHGMDLDSRLEIVNYRGIYYTRKIPSTEELDMFHNGIVIVVYGWNYIDSLPMDMKCMNIVTNTYISVIEKVDQILLDFTMHNRDMKLLIRDVLTPDDVDQVKQQFAVDITHLDYLFYDSADYENAVKCQATQIIRFNNASNEMKKYIETQIQDLFPELKKSKIRKAVSLAGKGG